MDLKEVIFGRVGLSIILSSCFYEHARNYNSNLKSLAFRLDEPINDLKAALSELFKIDYKMASVAL